MLRSLFFEIPVHRSDEITRALLGAIPTDWAMVDGPMEHRGCALFCKEGPQHEHEARCHIVPTHWEGSFLSGREEGPQPPRVKLRGKKKHIGSLVDLCVSLGLVPYEPQAIAC